MSSHGPVPTEPRAGLNRGIVAVGLAAYGAAIAFVARRWQLPPIGPEAALLLTGALLMEIVAKGLFGVQFRHVLSRQGHQVTLRAAVHASFIGTAVARLVPAGGAFSPTAMAWGIRAEDHHAAGAALRITLTGYGGLLLVTGTAVAGGVPMGRSPIPAASGVALAILLVLIGSMILLGSRWLDRAVGLLPRFLRRHFGPTAGGGATAKVELGLIVSRVLLEGAVLWTVLGTFGIDLDPGQAMLTYGTAKLIAGLPATPGGIGLVEGGMIGLLTALGHRAETVVAPVLVYQIIDYWIMAAIGLVAAGRLPTPPPNPKVIRERPTG